MCDLCKEPLDGDSFGQTTADTVICADCLCRLKRRQEQDARLDCVVVNTKAGK